MTSFDITETLAPRSDQLNADDLVAAPRTVTVVDVRAGSAEQPVEIVTNEYGSGRPYKPGKSMRRVLGRLWGTEASAWVGKSMTLYCDPDITFGRDKTGGIRISHMSHIDGSQTMPLTVTRGKRSPFTVKQLETPAPSGPTADDVAACTDTDALRNMWQAATPDVRALIQARGEALKAARDDVAEGGDE